MKSSAELNAMSKADLVAMIEKLQTSRMAPVRRYVVNTAFHRDLVKLLSGRKLQIWNLLSTKLAGKTFDVDDAFALYPAVPGVKLPGKDGGRGHVRFLLNFLASIAFITLQPTPKAAKKAEGKLASVGA